MWQAPPLPSNEAPRLRALDACRVMDTPADPRFDRISWLARHIYQADIAFISFIDARTQWIKSQTEESLPRHRPRETSVCQVIVSTGEALASPDLASDPRFQGHPALADQRIGFYAGVPLLAQGTLPIGTLCVLNATPWQAGQIDLEPLQTLATIAADEVEMARHNEELARHSRIDTLTGLANRRAFDEGLERARSRCQRTGEPLALLMIDLDAFKSVNDGFGHPAGDEMLRLMGGVLGRVELRNGDLMARYGGEEFGLILPGADLRAAHGIAVRLRTRLSTSGIRRPDGQAQTVSIGVASHPAGVLDTGRLLAAADGALYQAKQAGRDRIVCAGAP